MSWLQFFGQICASVFYNLIIMNVGWFIFWRWSLNCLCFDTIRVCVQKNWCCSQPLTFSLEHKSWLITTAKNFLWCYTDVSYHLVVFQTGNTVISKRIWVPCVIRAHFTMRTMSSASAFKIRFCVLNAHFLEFSWMNHQAAVKKNAFGVFKQMLIGQNKTVR